MTREEYEERVDRLRRRHPNLFARGAIGWSIAPAWYGLVEDLCMRIDAALTASERKAVRIVQIKEKFGALRVYLNVAPPRVDLVAPGGVASDTTAPRRGGLGAGIAARLAPLVADAEAASSATCLFCGAPGRQRGGCVWLLTLCDRHAPYTYHHLTAAFEQMSDPTRPVTPPSRETVIAVLQAAADQFRVRGIRDVGLRPPLSAAMVWRLVVDPKTETTEAVRLAEALLRWPVEPAGEGGEDGAVASLFGAGR